MVSSLKVLFFGGGKNFDEEREGKSPSSLIVMDLSEGNFKSQWRRGLALCFQKPNANVISNKLSAIVRSHDPDPKAVGVTVTRYFGVDYKIMIFSVNVGVF